MNDALREALAQRAHDVDPPEVHVGDIVGRGERRLRRRRLGAVTGSVLAVALVVGTPAVVEQLDEEPRSVVEPDPVEPPDKPDDAVDTRPLVYLQGSTLHVGSQKIDTELTAGFSQPAAAARAGRRVPGSRIMNDLQMTDEGAVFTTLDGRIWFSDGASVQHIGGVPGKEPDGEGAVVDRCGSAYCFFDAVDTDPVAGSRVVWLERASGGQVDLVDYDTAQRGVRNRLALPLPPRAYAFLEDVHGDHVYWTRYSGRGNGQPRLMRTVVSASLHEPATQRMLAAERQGKARTLVVGRGAAAEAVVTGQNFQVSGTRLEPVRFDHDVTNANYFVPVFHPVTGERLRFSAPQGVRRSNELALFQWLDDDRFALSRMPRWDNQDERRDIVVCRISTERCEITVLKGPGPWLGLPGQGFPG